MRAAIAALAVLLLLAGCASSPDAPASPSPTQPSASTSVSGTATGGTTPKAPAPPVAIDLSWDGTLGTGAEACVANVGCHAAFSSPGGWEKIVNVTEGRLRSVRLAMTWSAPTPATETLTLIVMVMDHCGGCNVTLLGSATGPSPLEIDVTGLDLGVGERNWLHAFAYNPKVASGVPGTAGVYASLDQAFRVAGSATVQPT